MIAPAGWSSARRLLADRSPPWVRAAHHGRPPRFRNHAAARDLAMAGLCVAAAIAIFTPAAYRVAESDTFWPLLSALLGMSASACVARGLLTGRIRPWLEGCDTSYMRVSHPRRFWAAMAWNTVLGIGALWLALAPPDDAPTRDLEACCLHWTDSTPPAAALAACNTLVAAQGVHDSYTAGLIAARGSAYLRQDDLTRAAAAYVEAIRIDPTVSATYYNLGRTDQRFGDLGLAIDDFSAAIRVDPDNIDAHLRRGFTLMDIGRSDRAIADFTAAHRARPADPIPLANRGLAHAWTGDNRRAAQDFRAARARGPADPVLLRGEALLAYRTGRLPVALRRLDEALHRDPGDGWSRALRADIRGKLGRTAERDADLRELNRRAPPKRSR